MDYKEFVKQEKKEKKKKRLFKKAILLFTILVIIVAGYFIANSQWLYAGWILGFALLVGCGIMVIVGKTKDNDEDDIFDLYFDPLYTGFSFNVWHEKEDDDYN